MLISLVIGFVVGVVAKVILPGKDPGGLIITTLIGMAGAWIAHYIGAMAGVYGESDPVGFIAAVGGSLVLLLAYRLLIKL